jgi:ATP-dependent DNA helicase RecQ
MPMKKAKEILKEVFGYSEFRPDQEAIIDHIMSGKDTIVLMPTGGGKSVCFQIPALLKTSGVTLVVSPLISLMKDQVESIKSNGISAAYYNSSQTEKERYETIYKAEKGALKLLYMSPETILLALNSWLRGVQLNLVAIDEAHCVSMWGHDFRPEYTQLQEIRRVFPDIPFVALTATADKATRKEIEQKLGLINPKTFLSSFDRPNIYLEVRGNVPKAEKLKEILSFIKSKKGESGIIYCLSRNETEDISAYLVNNGVRCAYYHAGLTADERNNIQEDFITDRMPVITATLAFGMGIDKSNVRWVIHANLPKNLEGYYQEIGRAGRDGIKAFTRLYYNMRDVKLLADFAQESQHKEVLLEKLNRMLQYAESQTCRRITLLSYFSESVFENCGNCDVCLNPPDYFDGTVIAQKALSAISRTNQSLTMSLLIQVLRGAQTYEVLQNGYHLIKTHGAGKEHSFEAWRHFITQLLNLGLLEIAYDLHFHLKITPFGADVLFGKHAIFLTHFVAPKVKKQLQEKLHLAPEATPSDTLLFEELRQLRRTIAADKQVPPYIVFSDLTLREMAQMRPKNKTEFLDVSGVGKQKLENFGDDFLAAIADFERKNR